MLKSPHIDRLDWDDWNRAHIRKHAVVPEKAEEAVGGNAMIRVTYSQKLQYIGPTSEGRMLSVVVGSVPGRPFVSPAFSAPAPQAAKNALYTLRRKEAESMNRPKPTVDLGYPTEGAWPYPIVRQY